MYYHLSPEHRKGNPTHPLPKITSMVSLSSDEVLLGTSKGLYSFSQNGLASVHQKRWQLREINAMTGIRDAFWISSGNCLYKTDMKGNITDSFHIDEKEKVRHLAYSQKAGLWISTIKNKLYKYQSGVLHELNSELGTSGTSINKIFIDKAHNVWIATNEKGLFMAPYSPFNYLSVANGLSDDRLHYRFRISDSEQILVLSLIHIYTGAGEVIEQLEAGEKIHSTRGTSGETGTGLGLRMCKEFVESQKGKMLITPEQGKGTTFSILLPK